MIINGSSFFGCYILCEGRIVGTRAAHVIRSTDRRAYNGDIIFAYLLSHLHGCFFEASVKYASTMGWHVSV